MGMSWLAQLVPVALAATFLNSAGPRARVSLADLRVQQHGDFDRIRELMAPIAQAVLAAPDREELAYVVEEQLFTGLFSDLVFKSVQAVSKQPERALELEEFADQFLAAVEPMGGNRTTASNALLLSQIARYLALAFVKADVVDVEEYDGPTRLDLHDFFYDIETPLELRKAARVGLESAVCMIALTYAVGSEYQYPEWMVTELVERWFAGQSASLPMFAAIAREHGIDLEDVLPEHLIVTIDRLEHDGEFYLYNKTAQAVQDLAEGKKRAETMASQIRVIVEHASRQPDGVWPKK